MASPRTGYFAVLPLVAACGAANIPPAALQSSTLAAPSRGLHLRAAFDDDASAYVGRFLPDDLPPGEVDENAGATTRCSKFFKTRVVNVDQTLDESMDASNHARASLGVPPLAALAGREDAASKLRVRYHLTKKLLVEPDADKLDACCHADPSQCTGRILGEFYQGSGEIMQASTEASSGRGSMAAEGVVAGGDASEAKGWKRVSTFKDMYFAFQTTKTASGLAAGKGADASDCSWCDKLPGSLDGKYFCGVSPDAPAESMSRDLALRHAREQVVQFLGEKISTESKSTASLMAGYLDDKESVSAMASGVASRVKDERWCREQVPTPEGMKTRSRVLAFVPNAQLADATRDAVTALVQAKKAAGKLTKPQEKELQLVIEKTRSRGAH